MLQNAHQFAVSYPFVRCHDSLVVKKKSSSLHANEGGRSGKENRKHAHNSQRVSSLPLFTEFGSIAFVNSFDYMTDDRKPVCFLQHHKC